MRINFEGLSNATTVTRLPKGLYEFQIDSVNADHVAKTGARALEVVAHVTDGMDFDDGSSTVGLRRTMRFWYPNSNQKDGGKFCLGRLNDFVKACGMDTSRDEFDTDDLIGQSFRCRVKIVTDDRGDNEEYDKFKAAN